MSQYRQQDNLLGQSDSFLSVLDQVSQLANLDKPVLIIGERGTGKELIAARLHFLSKRWDQSYVKLNCAALNENLLESELFGHESGAFTGASKRHEGRFERANSGTLFLDEVAELPLESQSKLLRVLQEREFERVGGSQTLKVDIRIIAATNRNLWEMVQAGQFRMDLYYRLNVFPIHVPALKERKEDIPYLCQNLIAQINKRLVKQLQGLSTKAIRQLQAYDWPGNIRELQNVLEREAILSKHSTLQLSQSLKAGDDNAINPTLTLDEAQKQHISSVLALCNWKIAGEQGAANKLGLPESTLRSKMQKLGLRRQS